ncbi:MAG: ABC transporter permease, partial [Alphaproteobacteria bacterium]
MTPMNARRLENFRANRRGYVSLWIFLALFIVTLFAEVIANDKPLIVSHDGGLYSPVFVTYPETTFGGDFPTEADYRDPYIIKQIEATGGWILWPLIRYSYDTINFNLDG